MGINHLTVVPTNFEEMKSEDDEEEDI
jgi:hypothetical protein